MSRLCRRSFLALTILLGLTQWSFAAELYEARVFQNEKGEKLNYRLMLPQGYEANGTAKYPLVLFLHGSGERGDDNQKQLIHATGEFATPENRQKYPAFVLAPQCPDGKRWVEIDWTLGAHKQLPEDSATIKLVLELIASLQKEYPIDQQRQYLTGLSMGGFGTWDLLTRHPEMWAAAAPVCGGGDETVASQSVKVPVWAFHGDQDTVVKPHRSRNMIQAIKQAGGQTNYTEYKGVGHNSWAPAYADPKLLEWMFAQKRS
ncbi:MAG: alpha/beta hydrolase-fold protein [Planctomycetota bacterium]